MAYTINRTDGTVLAVIDDGTVDETTDLRLIGKNYAGYGEWHNENFLHLLENFSSSVAPDKPVSGQLWFNPSNKFLSVFDGKAWKQVNGTIVSATPPVAASVGDFWFNNTTSQLFVWGGSKFVLVSPPVNTNQSEDAVGGTIALRTSSTLTDRNLSIPPGALKATYFLGTASATEYADLAEKYLCDKEYSAGTVMMVGGEKEVTASTLDSRAIGVISEYPAVLMNSTLEGGQYVALKGRVPVKVVGPVKKGDRLIAANNGAAMVAYMPSQYSNTFAVALVSDPGIGVKLVEAVIL